MARLQAGTDEALDVLIERYRRPLSAFLFRFLGDRHTAEDLLQETFARAHRSRDSYRTMARFSTWIYTIAGNLARSEFRRRKRRTTVSLHGQTPQGEEYELVLPSETHLPNSHAESVIQDRFIRKALERLPEEFREAVVLRDVQQLPYEDIMAITGLPMGTVKSRIHRGRARLQELLRDVYLPDEGA